MSSFLRTEEQYWLPPSLRSRAQPMMTVLTDTSSTELTYSLNNINTCDALQILVFPFHHSRVTSILLSSFLMSTFHYTVVLLNMSVNTTESKLVYGDRITTIHKYIDPGMAEAWSGGARPLRFLQNRRPITTCRPRFSDLAPSLRSFLLD